jgi:hypothetical protein
LRAQVVIKIVNEESEGSEGFPPNFPNFEFSCGVWGKPFTPFTLFTSFTFLFLLMNVFFSFLFHNSNACILEKYLDLFLFE